MKAQLDWTAHFDPSSEQCSDSPEYYDPSEMINIGSIDVQQAARPLFAGNRDAADASNLIQIVSTAVLLPPLQTNALRSLTHGLAARPGNGPCDHDHTGHRVFAVFIVFSLLT